jgi:serine/threonine protein kinase/Tol biopolymer transport system component
MMAMTTGTRMGRYEIRSLLGAGGMGEVYRATDPKLNRDVAIKVLPAAFSADPERLRRFEQEAQTAGALNHPNILAIYDVATHEGAPYVVSELLEGETLRQRFKGGALPARKALDYALQIARGLAAAHEKGIVHRDLKPENLFLTSDGRIKILDFGLAKLIEPKIEAATQTGVPTRALPTDPGTVMGTAGYMSPEQVRGQPVDHRSDIFSLGVILYEMLAGERPFRGESAVETLNAILKEDPPELTKLMGMNDNASLALERVIRHCLEKSLGQRFQSVNDVAFALEALSGLSDSKLSVAVTSGRAHNRERLAWVLASIGFACCLAALPFVVTYFRHAKPDVRPIFLSVPLPEKASPRRHIAVSPDGQFLAFVASNSEGTDLLWLRPLGSPTTQALSGTDGANCPFWSPDSRSIGFFAQGKLKKIDVSGGPAQTLCDAPDGFGGAWNRDGVIVFTPNWGVGLYRVSAGGGEATTVTALDASRRESVHLRPYFLPDNRHFLYLAYGAQRETVIYIGSLDSKEAKRLLNADSYAAYTPPGYVLYVREGVLLAQPFDANQLQLTGESFSVAGQVGYYPGEGYASFSVSENGVLAYKCSHTINTQLVWFNRTGKELGAIPSTGEHRSLRLSPDGKRVAFGRTDQQKQTDDIWLLDLPGGTPRRFTFNNASDFVPVWSAGGDRIIFSSDREGPYDLYQKASSGATEETELFPSSSDKIVTDWSADGRLILYENLDPKTKYDLWVLPFFGDRKPRLFLRTQSNEQQAEFSPDGKWVAYTSDQSGKSEVYVQSFPASGGKSHVSTDGGADPRWRRDGKELFYLSPERKLMAVPVKGETAFEPGVPKVLFQTRVPALTVYDRNFYDVTKDGQRFLINTLMDETVSSSITLVLNWTARLKR